MSGIDTGGAVPADWQSASGDDPEAFGGEMTVAQAHVHDGGLGCRPMTAQEQAVDLAGHAGNMGIGLIESQVGQVVTGVGATVYMGGAAGGDDPMARGTRDLGAAMVSGGVGLIIDGGQRVVNSAIDLRNGALNPNAQICD
ncbi:hypothetical protein [Futiania mangrovi]|uniref:Uncharacterized protein n=1 Tax=Futiania mangrovi TaxID=2959716 RepID=A0A9J6PH94_9PROT|nr:hypothetical protein [Futiania mangrovii]MCP1335959.1 hypothetical protein [Futiania mangrovii]